jgi:conjugative relaxase-like TrwC/TraI family protein
LNFTAFIYLHAMLRITPNKSSLVALTYFDDGLSTPDYYSEDDKAIGLWGGLAAAQLGLSGEVSRNDFAKLCNNVNPINKCKLTARNREDRTVLYDFTFSTPKSVSLIFSQTKDKDILTALNLAISQTMMEIEKNAQTRVRTEGKNENRTTGNLKKKILLWIQILVLIIGLIHVHLMVLS